jgi:DNA-binding NarL/FixJ family response regulator
LAKELAPDLILLDIGLPKLNGFEAAKRITLLSPLSKVLFLSQEISPDLVEQAFELGACGYVVKSDAVRDLLDAVQALERGDRFLGRRFVDPLRTRFIA